MKEDQNDNLLCIECANKIKSIFKVYSDGFKDVIECPKCKNIVDDYVECEYSVILIDLILFKERTYRHIIYNKEIQRSILFKILLTFSLCDAYLYWFNLKNRQFESIRSNDQQLFYELEWNFYYMLIKAFINYFIFTSIILILCLLDEWKIRFSAKKSPPSFNKESIYKFSIRIVKSLILSSFGKMFVLPLVVWNPNQVFFHLALVFTYISNSQALYVATRMNQMKAIVIVSIAAILVHFLNTVVNTQIESFRVFI